MNILFLYVSLPHLSESGVFSDLIREFAKRGHLVKVAVPMNKDSVEGINIESGIEVLRFKTDQLARNKSNIQKGIAFIKFIFQSLHAIKKHFRRQKFDLIIAHSFPPEMSIVVKSLKRKYKAKFYLMLCEYVWQDSVSLGFFKENSIICKYYQWLERMIIKSADYIGSPSQGNVDFTLKYYPWAKNHNIHILHYSQAPIQIKLKGEEIKKKYSLENRFIAIYGGNMTIAQKIENVIDLAKACIDYPDIVFLLLGRGPQIEMIKKNVKIKNLNNIIFLDFLPKDEYNALLSVSDVGIVSLNEKMAVPNIPSKTLSYFSLSKPIIASIDRNTDYGRYLEISGGGLWSYAGDTTIFKENLLTLYQNPELLKSMGESGYRFYRENMLPEKTYQTITDFLN